MPRNIGQTGMMFQRSHSEPGCPQPGAEGPSAPAFEVAAKIRDLRSLRAEDSPARNSADARSLDVVSKYSPCDIAGSKIKYPAHFLKRALYAQASPPHLPRIYV